MNRHYQKSSATVLTLHTSYALPRRGLPASLSFHRWIEATLRHAHHRKKTELSLRVVDLDEGRALNRQYRGKDYATNILSFPTELPKGVSLPLLGDLVICAPVVAQEADQQGKLLRDHYAHLTVHGVLHLLGYTHQTRITAHSMETLEKQILKTFSITDPYLLDNKRPPF